MNRTHDNSTLTFWATEQITAIIQQYRDNPSNSNKYRFELFAYIDDLLVDERRKVEKSLIQWALQAEPASSTGPAFATEPLAVAHRLIERMKELDPDFAKQMEGEATV